MNITVSIVTFHTSLVEIKRLLKSVLSSPVHRVYIIDNSSNDGLRELVTISDRIVYIHSLNFGYGAGHNIAIKKAIETSMQYHIVINPDIYFGEGVIEELVSFADKATDCGLVMPKILYPNGDLQCLCKLLPSPWDLFGRRFIPIHKYAMKSAQKYELHFSGYNRVMDVPSLSGCFMFMRVDVLKRVGGFDERFFMYAEDLDLCRRIGEVARTVFYPNVSVYHEYGKESYKNKRLLKYHICSVIKYFNKWGWFLDNNRKKINDYCLQNLKDDFS